MSDNIEKHKVAIDFSSYSGLDSTEIMKKLARDLASLRYDALRDLLNLLSEELIDDSYRDKARRRFLLSRRLLYAAIQVEGARDEIGRAWDISKPHMNLDSELPKAEKERAEPSLEEIMGSQVDIWLRMNELNVSVEDRDDLLNRMLIAVRMEKKTCR